MHRTEFQAIGFLVASSRRHGRGLVFSSIQFHLLLACSLSGGQLICGAKSLAAVLFCSVVSPLSRVCSSLFLFTRVRSSLELEQWPPKATVVWELLRVSCTASFDICPSCEFSVEFLCESLQGDPGIVFESPVQKTRGFVVQIALPRWFFERSYQVFSEIPMRI
jgi:hypothetical protein